uniref:DUF4220 domain-containing protein n=1 Tax=Oryza rufipogon TaxID=4529 RepID=A0A0E0P586_ORYRU
MLFVGVAKYVERTMALRRANLANVRKSVQIQRRRRRAGGGSRRRTPNFEFLGDDEESALVMKAHALFHVCKNSMVDSFLSSESESSTDNKPVDYPKETLFCLEWSQMFRVMEVELSLMYDFLYTKASVIHTWHGYAIRAVSPVFTAVSLVLVELSNVGSPHRRSDVVITRVLLVATFFLETASLLRAVSSTRAGFLLYRGLPPGWIHHEALCRSRWLRFHRAVASIGWLANTQDHRRWSGKMGQLSVLRLITGGERVRSASMAEDRSWDKECERYSEKTARVIPQDVKEVVFRRVRDLLTRKKTEAAEMRADMDVRKKSMAANLRTKRGQITLQKRNLLSELGWSLGNEIQLAILTWHIATEIYLLLSPRTTSTAVEDDARRGSVSRAVDPSFGGGERKLVPPVDFRGLEEGAQQHRP